MEEIVTKTMLDTALESVSAGGVYLEDGVEKDYVFVVSDTDPGATTTYRGKTVDVWWVQPTPPDPGAWVAKAPTFNTVGATYTIPSDAGATYTVGGATKAAGTYTATRPSTVTVAAVAKVGYTLAGATEWSQTYDEVTYPYDAAVAAIGVQHYYRMDEGAGHSGVPVDRGLGGPGVLQTSNVSPILTTGYTGVGVGPTSYRIVQSNGDSTGMFKMGDQPTASVTSYTFAAVLGVKRHTNPSTGQTSIRAELTNDWGGKNKLGLTYGAFTSPNWSVNLASTGPTVSATGVPVTVADTDVVHLAQTWDGTTVRGYLNGVKKFEYADAGPITKAAQQGFLSGNYDFHAAGLVIDFSKALTDAQILSLANAVQR